METEVEHSRFPHSAFRSELRTVSGGVFALLTVWATVAYFFKKAGITVPPCIVPGTVFLISGLLILLRKASFIRRTLDLFRAHSGDWIAIGWILLSIYAVDFADSAFHLSPPVNALTGSRDRALVLDTDNSRVLTQGPLAMGEQRLKVRMLAGEYKGRELDATNLLKSQMELDSVYKPSDEILVSVFRHTMENGETVLLTNAVAHYRTHYELGLFFGFALLLLLFGGLTGLKAFLTFLFTFAAIWQLLIPLCLKGWDPVWISLGTVSLLCALIIFAVAGFDRKGWTAFSGAFLGVLFSCGMALAFTELLKVNGNVQARSQALFFAGYEYLDMTRLFIGAVFLASSGAVMDLGMDVAAGMREIVLHRPEIPRGELLKSGLRIGRAVVGTMTTTLLLAYSGGFLTLMMSFAAEGVPFIDIVNYPYVVPEIVKTLVGSIGLVLVAPFTALTGCLLLPLRRRSGTGAEEKPH